MSPLLAPSATLLLLLLLALASYPSTIIAAMDVTGSHLRSKIHGDSLFVNEAATEGYIYNWLSHYNCDAVTNPPYRTSGNPTNVCLVAANGIDSVQYSCTNTTYSQTNFDGLNCDPDAQSGDPTVSPLGCETDGNYAHYWQCSDSTDAIVLPEGSGAWAVVNYYDSSDAADDCSGDIVEYKGTLVNTCIALSAFSSQFVTFPNISNYNNADCSGTPSSVQVMDTSCAVASPTDDDSVGITGYTSYLDENTGDTLLPTVIPSQKPSVDSASPAASPSASPSDLPSQKPSVAPTSSGVYPNGYLYSYYSLNGCESSKNPFYGVQGVPTNICLLQSAETSVLYTCKSSGYTITKFDSANCDPATQNGLAESNVYGCHLNYGVEYYTSHCSQNTDSIPLPSNTGDWMVVKYYNTDECDSDLVSYEGEPTDTCNVVSLTTSTKITFPNASTWANTDCYGEPTKGTVYGSTTCATTQQGEDDDIGHGALPTLASNYIATLQKSPGSSSNSNSADELSPEEAALVAAGCISLIVIVFLLLDFFVLGGVILMRCGIAPYGEEKPVNYKTDGVNDIRSPVLG